VNIVVTPMTEAVGSSPSMISGIEQPSRPTLRSGVTRSGARPTASSTETRWPAACAAPAMYARPIGRLGRKPVSAVGFT
jgi:hypothetical protein